MNEESRSIIVCESDRCTGCECCVLACSGAHFRAFSPANSRIRVEVKEPMDVKAVTCRQCKNPACLEACPVGAIYREDGLVVVEANACTGCGACIERCPFEAIVISSISGKAIKCDLCGGEPECVKACIHHALAMKEVRF